MDARLQTGHVYCYGKHNICHKKITKNYNFTCGYNSAVTGLYVARLCFVF